MNEIERILEVEDGHVSLVENPAEGPCHGTVVLVPPFAMQARNLFPIALTLCRNGFRVVRVDGRDSLGGGSGEIFRYRMATVAADVSRVLEALQRDRTVSTPILLAGLSLSARAVVRGLTSRPCDGAVLLTPVFHLRSTLEQVLGQDLFAVRDADAPPSLRVLGQLVSWDFIRDARAHHFVDLDTTFGELAQLTTPTTLLCGDEDPWVSIADVRAAAAVMNPAADVTVVRAASHELNRNPRIAMTYIDHLTAQCLALAGWPGTSVELPPFSEVIAELGRTPRRPRIEQTSVSLLEKQS
jgi:pimeloyl-ACP methyl ester carboxylesterase